MKRDLLSILDLSAPKILGLIAKAEKMKAELAAGTLPKSLTGKIVGLIFLKPSTRTRVSFERPVVSAGRPRFLQPRRASGRASGRRARRGVGETL